MAQFRRDSHQYLANGNTIFEVVMLADQYGNRVGSANPTGMAVDAFGRARTSLPITLFDSFHRYQDNNSFATANSGPLSTSSFSANEGLVNLTIGTNSGDHVYRETKRVFAYQPGKSLQILTTFVANSPKENLRQRIGYYGSQNGIYYEIENDILYFVERSNVTGIVTNTRIPQSEWNIDKLDGTGASGYVLDPSKAQILFMDIEWLGLGTVRLGFVINGELVHCHSIHHANLITSTYMTTACLPIRYEIENTGATSSNSTLKQICSSVISEGGYELKGRPRTAGLNTNAPRDLTTAHTFYPVVSIRLKSTTPDCIVTPTSFSLVGISSANYQFTLNKNATITGGTWVPLANSNIEYNISGTAMSGGEDLESGYITSTNQARDSIPGQQDLFKYQLERDSFANTFFAFTLGIRSGTAGADVLASLNWQEIT